MLVVIQEAHPLLRTSTWLHLNPLIPEINDCMFAEELKNLQKQDRTYICLGNTLVQNDAG